MLGFDKNGLAIAQSPRFERQTLFCVDLLRKKPFICKDVSSKMSHAICAVAPLPLFEVNCGNFR